MPILLHFFEAVRNRVGEIPWVTGEPRVQHPTLVVDGPNLTLAGYQDGAPLGLRSRRSRTAKHFDRWEPITLALVGIGACVTR
jgi:hypothetical protein